ncbi:hypothetical protein ONZ45_g14560 [Pleurotus djamor]|nr:hypothetical protein ONZ45_g14560 [Pleurotus djamor]
MAPVHSTAKFNQTFRRTDGQDLLAGKTAGRLRPATPATTTRRTERENEAPVDEMEQRSSRHRRLSEREAQRQEEEAALRALKAHRAEKRREKECEREELEAAAEDPTYDPEPRRHRREPADYDEESADEMFPSAPPRSLSHRLTRVPPRLPISDDEDDDEPTTNSVSQAPISASEATSSNEGTKRPYADDSDSDDLPLKQPRLSSTRPKLADYPPDTQEILLRTIQLWRLRLFTTNAFPTVQDEAAWVGELWTEACKQLNATCTLEAKASRLITSRTSHTRGEVKTKVKPFVASTFELEAGQNPKLIAKMRKRVELLKEESHFTYAERNKDPSKRKGLYKGKILQKCVNAIWFANRRDEGITYAKSFSPLPIPALALILTAIENCLDEWATGVYTSLDFAAADYEAIYNDHLSALKELDKESKDIGLLTNIRTWLYNVGRFHTGAEAINAVRPTVLSKAAIKAALKEYEEDPATETDGEDGEATQV